MYNSSQCVECGETPVVLEDGAGDTFIDFCSHACKDAFDASEADDEEMDFDGEPMGSHDLSDDADALASAGFGMDEDYGGGGWDD